VKIVDASNMISHKDIYERLKESAPISMSESNFSDVTAVEPFSTAGIDEIIKCSINFNRVSFRSLSLYSNDFQKQVVFKDCTFDRFEIVACEFYDILVFENCIFKTRFKLVDSVFGGPAKFHKCDFLEGINLFDKHDSFGSVEFKGGLYLF